MSDFEYRLKIPGTTPIPQLNMSITLEELTDLGVLNGGNECIYIDADRVKRSCMLETAGTGTALSPLAQVPKVKGLFIDRKVPRQGVKYWL